MKKEDNNNKNGGRGVGLRAFILGALLSGVFAWITVLRNNGQPTAYLSANLIPVLPHAALILAGLLVNPFLRRVRIMRLFTKGELLLIFVMCSVSAGLASFGLCPGLVSNISTVYYESWNTDQSEWDIHAIPFMKDKYFMVAKGTQAEAKRLREAHLEYEKASKTLQAARGYKLSQEELASVKADLKKIASIPDSKKRAQQEKAMEWPLEQATEQVETAVERWNKISEGQDPQVVCDTYEDKIEKLKEIRDGLRQDLKDLNADTIAVVEEIRKGFPSEKRAFPGFFYSRGEGLVGYKARIKRLRVGGASLKEVEAAQRQMAEAIAASNTLPNGWSEDLTSAANMLESISDVPEITARYEAGTEELEDAEDRIAEHKVKERRLRAMRRYSEQSQFNAFDEQLDKIEKEREKLTKEAEKIRERVEKSLKPQVDLCERVRATRTNLLAIAEEARAATVDDYPDLMERLEASVAAYNSFDATARRFWLGDARWDLWLGPIMNWLIIIFIGYMVFMTFNALIFRQWAHNEKLIYPLAEVATELATSASVTGKQKTLLNSGLFWTGFAVAAGVLGWNHLAGTGIIPNVNPIKLQTLWLGYVGGGIFQGLGSTYFCIIFAVIGITFLVPASISFSLWFFEVLYMILLIVMCKMGYGVNRWSIGNPARFELGSGATLVFGAVILWTCRKYLLCAFKPEALQGLERDERRELRVCSVLFLTSSVALILMLSLGMGTNIFFVTIYFFIAMAFTIALVRAVAEGGVLGIEGFRAVTVLKMIFGSAGGWWLPAILAPAGAFMGTIFSGVKSFIPAMMANAFKIREDIRIRRSHFHVAIWVGIVVAVAVSVVTIVILSYSHGADNLNGWLNRGQFAQGVKGGVLDDGIVKPTKQGWMAGGAIMMGLLLFVRTKVFWFPHPIGLLMLMNPVMFGFWGSILLGWIFKSLVSKYCSHEQYISIRRFFIGLVLGHLCAVMFGWDMLKFHWG